MFGISLSEVVLIAIIALIFVGPQKLPTMLRTLGQWIRKLRDMTTQVRAQTGIDEILKQEGIEGGIAELRGLIRGDLAQLARARHDYNPSPAQRDDPYERAYELDRYREYPLEGADAHGAVPDDLVDDSALAESASPETSPETREAETISPENGETQNDEPKPLAPPTEKTERPL